MGYKLSVLDPDTFHFWTMLFCGLCCGCDIARLKTIKIMPENHEKKYAVNAGKTDYCISYLYNIQFVLFVR